MHKKDNSDEYSSTHSSVSHFFTFLDTSVHFGISRGDSYSIQLTQRYEMYLKNCTFHFLTAGQLFTAPLIRTGRLVATQSR